MAAREIPGLATVLERIDDDAMAPAAAWCERQGVDNIYHLKELGDDGEIEAFMNAAGLKDFQRKLVKKRILELAPPTAIHVGITMQEITEQLDAMSAKLDANTNANERQLQRGLVESVRQELNLLPVVKKIVDGDGAGAFAALDAFSAEVRESAAAKYVEGMALYQQKKWSETIVALNDCVELDQENSKAWFALGLAYWEQNGRKNCKAEFVPYTKCIEFDPNHAVARNNLGLLYEEQKDYKNAEKMYREAIQCDQTHALAWWNLSAILEERDHNIPGAIDAVKEFINRGGDSNNEFLFDGEAEARLMRLLATYQIERKDYDGVAELFRDSIRLDPSGGPNAMVYWNLSLCLLGTPEKDIPGAIKAIEEFISRVGDLDNDHKAKIAKLYVTIGEEKIKRKEYNGAEEMFRKAIRLDPSGGPNAMVYWNLSIILSNIKDDLPGAIKAIENFVRHGGDPSLNGEAKIARLYGALGQRKLRCKDYKGAEEMYRAAIKRDPENEGLFLNNLGIAMKNQEHLNSTRNSNKGARTSGQIISQSGIIISTSRPTVHLRVGNGDGSVGSSRNNLNRPFRRS